MTTSAKLCLLICGGTITMVQDPRTKTLVPSTEIAELTKQVPELASIAKIDSLFVTNIDSSNMLPDTWVRIAEIIVQRAEQYDGFVVTHGTDTMAYTASAMSFLLQGLGKPVVFTGAQMPISEEFGSDARNNLVFAATFATQDIGEVCIFFGAELLRANRARKFSQFDFDAFKSFNTPAIGKIGIRPKLAEHRIRRALPSRLATPHLEQSVYLLKYFPGMKASIIPLIIAQGFRGIVIEGVGAGNLPSVLDFAGEIKRATNSGVPVVMTTQCIVGAAEMYIYEVGKFAEQNGAISAFDMTPEAALTKLMWVLGQTSAIDDVRSLMQRNLAGEMSE
ncbi:MAG: asparaginase [Oligoflexia bacterium]|nr:asparaginase [Oligoflexia bacterium]